MNIFDSALVARLKDAIKKQAFLIGRPVGLMEVCGSHTSAIGRYGIRKLLPESIRLISGPGCPVCVTSSRDVDMALALSAKKNVIFSTVGGMLRVPGSNGNSLQKIGAQGADIRVVASTSEAIEIAVDNPTKDVIFMGIGFETASPEVASMVKTCLKKGIKNISVFSVHKRILPAMKSLLRDPELAIDGFLCPGHISTIIGFEGYSDIVERGRAAVIAGFGPEDILEGIRMILEQILQGRYAIENQYNRPVNPRGDVRAQEMLREVFMSVPAEWRGLGVIEGSGLVFNDVYSGFNTLARFDMPIMDSSNIMGCMCGTILRGLATPEACPLFRHACNPDNPIGPCMVSCEGACYTYYHCH